MRNGRSWNGSRLLVLGWLSLAGGLGLPGCLERTPAPGGAAEGEREGAVEGEGEGVVVGEGEGEPEGAVEGEGEAEGVPEPEGAIEGEGDAPDLGADPEPEGVAEEEGAASLDAGIPDPVDLGQEELPHFSFFVTSLTAMRELSGSQNGFGGDLRYGEEGPGAGLRGADKICSEIAERSMPGASRKGWRAFLSARQGEDGQQVNAIDRIGDGPWYDRLGRVFALNRAALLNTRPAGADPAIINDFPNEDGVPNHQPDPTRPQVDNHDFLTGTNSRGQLYSQSCTCLDWTSATGNLALEGRPRVGHSWPRGGGRPGGHGGGEMDNWMSALDEAGCKAGINLIENGAGDQSLRTVGAGGGYGGIYCFALEP